jgi:dihydroorotate dehydrogenase electron transfer subunit
MIQTETVIRANDPVGGGCWRMMLDAPPEYGNARPGQFVTLRFPDGSGPLLRRPFSIHGAVKAAGSAVGVELLYKVVGGFTQRLSAMRPGGAVDLLGPLGNDFGVGAAARRVWMVAGGIGVAPLAFLAQRLAERGVDMASCALFMGGRSADDLISAERFAGRGMAVHATTEDGSAGEMGLVTAPLAREAAISPPDVVCACGPMPMLRAVAGIAGARGIPSRVSMETVMACGLGACLGCAVETAGDENGYRHVCRDGPVFDGGWLKR